MNNETSSRKLTAQQVADFHLDGFVIARNFFERTEVERLIETAKRDRMLKSKATGRTDADGKVSHLTLWNHPGDDLYSMFSRCRRVVDSMEDLLGGEVYHYHSKMMLKEPRVGGAWEWHQDYGYWYNNGCLLPLMASCLIAVDRANQANGCLQVLKGSHHMGRIDHGVSGEQVGADMERVNEAMKVFELVYAELEPGDAIFFHSNLLHRSDQNTSENSRWSLICCYNAARNNPYCESHHPRYTPLKKVDDSAILNFGGEGFSSNNSFMEQGEDHSAEKVAARS